MAASAATLIAHRSQRADVTAWIAVAAGSLGALVALLDISIVNSALPTIQGEIGATATEATWIVTAFLVAEIVIIPLTAWLERLLGLRTLLFFAVVGFTGFSAMCGLSSSLTMMVIGRTGQGLSGGILIPTAMTIVAKRLPPSQQPIGLALFGMTAVVGPVIGPLLGGWLTENLSWHYAFFINLPIGAVLLLLLLLGLPHERPNWEYLREADWLGIIGMILGLGGLTVVLEEGHREEWFESALILKLTVLTVIGFVMLGLGQVLAAKPVLKLRLVLNRQFGSVVLMAFALDMVVNGSTFVIPQFLALIAHYNTLQTGQVVFLMGVPIFFVMPFIPFLMRAVDIRLVVGAGLTIMALSCFVNTNLSVASAGEAFTSSQILRGIGMALTMLFLNQATVASVSKEDVGDASGIFNAARNLGGSFTLAALASFQDQRIWLHSRRMEEVLSANDPGVRDYLASLGQLSEPGLRTLAGTIQQQAFVMTYNDVFLVMAVATFATLPLILFLRPLPKGLSLAMH